MTWFDSWSSLIRVVVTALLAYAALIAFLRLSGKRTLSKLNAFDLVVTVALGSTLATVILSKDIALADGLLALALLVGLQYVVAWLSVRSTGFRRLIKNEPSLLFYEGAFLDAALRRARITREEVLAASRGQGVEGLADLRAVVLETDGTLSVVRAGATRPPDSTLSSVPEPRRGGSSGPGSGTRHLLVLTTVLLAGSGATPCLAAQGSSPTPRPQEPRHPLPYRSVDVRYPNPAAPGVILAATLTVPPGEGSHPAMLLVGGSGQSPRDQPFQGHRMMLVLADDLTRRGIATLRFDDRGAGRSTLGKTKIEDLTGEDFVSDARAGIAFLQARPEIDRRRIGIIGHSEGTRTAEIVAATTPGDVAYIVLLAAASAGLTKGEIVAAQSRAMARLAGLSPEAQAADSAFMRRALVVTRRETDAGKRLEEIGALAREALAGVPAGERAAVEPGIRARVQILASDNFHQDAVAPRRDYLSEVRCPVLALNGDKDILVSAENAPLLRKSLERGGNRDGTVHVLPGLNHMFQTARTGAMEEVGDIAETFAPSALRLIGDWLEERTS